MSQEPKSTVGILPKKPIKPSNVEEHVCKWTGCSAGSFPTLAALVTHVNNQHLVQTSLNLAQTPVRYACLWEGCSRFDVEQPSRFALLSHCRTHTGEKPYFCPIPECEKHFTRSDALAKHVKGVHDLHQHRDSIALMRYRVQKGKAADPTGTELETLSDERYSELLNKDYELRVPWWFSKDFTEVLGHQNPTLHTLLEKTLDSRQFDLANSRYKMFLESKNSDLFGILDVQQDTSLVSLRKRTLEVVSQYEEERPAKKSHAKTYEELQSELETANKIKEILTKKLDKALRQKRTLWAVNQMLLDANVKLGLPEDPNEVDDEILSEGIIKLTSP